MINEAHTLLPTRHTPKHVPFYNCTTKDRQIFCSTSISKTVNKRSTTVR